MIKEGESAPDFSATDQAGRTHRLFDYRGRWILLYFYPKDNTPGCTAEACAIRDNFSAFSDLEAVVLGVSADGAESHAKFAAKYRLPFILLSDTEKAISSLYEVSGLFKRASYLISPELKIAKAYPRVKPEMHAVEVINDLKKLSA